MGELRVAGKSRTGTPAGNHFPHRLHLPPDAFDMKTFCEVCTAKPATLVCCADDAVMCDSCDSRCASLLKKKNEDGRRLRSNSPRAPRKRGRRRRDDAPTTPRAARSNRLRPRIETPAVLSPSLTSPHSRPSLISHAASTPPTRWLPSTSASPSRPTPPSPCATSARCVRAITARNVSSRVSRDDARVRDRISPLARRRGTRSPAPHVRACRDFSPRRGPTAPSDRWAVTEPLRPPPLLSPHLSGEPRVRRVPRGPRVPLPRVRRLHSLRQRTRRQAPSVPHVGGAG